MTSEGSDFLYPFIDGAGTDATALLVDLAASAQGKAEQSARLQTATLEASRDRIDALAGVMVARFEAGGRLFVFGNGGSSTDAEGVVALFRTPPWGRPLPVHSLVINQAVLTALGNDVGFDLVFSRQLIAHARSGDMALGISTSGNSANLFEAFAEARRRHVLTIGFAGYDGGRMVTSDDVEHCLVVRADSVHRIQETQAAVTFDLWERVQEGLASPRQPSEVR